MTGRAGLSELYRLEREVQQRILYTLYKCTGNHYIEYEEGIEQESFVEATLEDFLYFSDTLSVSERIQLIKDMIIRTDQNNLRPNLFTSSIEHAIRVVLHDDDWRPSEDDYRVLLAIPPTIETLTLLGLYKYGADSFEID